MMRRALRRLRGDDSGLSLAELLVSGLLTICIMAMIGTMFIQTAKITANSTQTTKSNNVASNVANGITSVLRVATKLAKSGQAVPDPAIVEAGRETLTIYSLSNTSASNPSPVRVKYSVTPVNPSDSTEDRSVVEERCTSTSSNGFWVFGSCTVTSRNLGGSLTATTGVSDQLFRYYAANGDEILVAAGLMSAADRARVSSINVYVSVKAQGSNTKQTVISNRVVLGNLGLDSNS
jgi:Tfp pilus assembly protein PilW